MKPFVRTVFVGVLGILLYDSIGALASRSFGFDYSWLIIGTSLIYVFIGFSITGTLAFSLLAGMLVGLFDSTVGWYISWMIGPGQPQIEIGVPAIVLTIFFVTFLGGVLGFIGGLISKVASRQTR